MIGLMRIFATIVSKEKEIELRFTMKGILTIIN